MKLHAESSCIHGCAFPQGGSALMHQLLDGSGFFSQHFVVSKRFLASVLHCPFTNRAQILVPVRAPDIPQEDLWEL